MIVRWYSLLAAGLIALAVGCGASSVTPTVTPPTVTVTPTPTPSPVVGQVVLELRHYGWVSREPWPPGTPYPGMSGWASCDSGVVQTIQLTNNGVVTVDGAQERQIPHDSVEGLVASLQDELDFASLAQEGDLPADVGSAYEDACASENWLPYGVWLPIDGKGAFILAYQQSQRDAIEETEAVLLPDAT